jgi:hypothetical protein
LVELAHWRHTSVGPVQLMLVIFFYRFLEVPVAQDFGGVQHGHVLQGPSLYGDGGWKETSESALLTGNDYSGQG